MDNLLRDSSHLLGNTYKTYITPSLYNDIESQQFEPGLYIVYYFHGGIYGQNAFTVISFSNNYAPANAWNDTQTMVPNFDANNGNHSYHLQYNPYLRKIRNRTVNHRQYRLIRL